MLLPGNNPTLSHLIIIPLFWPLASPARNPASQSRKVLNVLYFDNCDGKEYPMRFVKWSFTRNRSATTISGEDIVTRDTKDPMTINYRIEKCKDKSNPDTCEYYTTWKWDDLCAIMNVLPFTSKIRSMHNPRLNCPFKKGHYYVRNAKFEEYSLMQFLSLSDNNQVLWKFRMEIFEKPHNANVSCVDFALMVVNLRMKNRSRK